MAKIKIGDVFSIKTKKGLAYLHYIGKGWDGIERVRVLDFFGHAEDINSLLLQANELFTVGFVVGHAYRTKYIDFVCLVDPKPYEIPKFTRKPYSISGEFKGWRVHDADKKQYQLLPELTVEQLKINPSGTFSGPLLIEWLENDFTLEKWNTEYILSNLSKS